MTTLALTPESVYGREWGEATWTARDEAWRELRERRERVQAILPLLRAHGAEETDG